MNGRRCLVNAVMSAVLWTALLVVSPSARPAPEQGLQCPPEKVIQPAPRGPVAHPHGLLWRITAPGTTPSYLFGTIHVSNPEVLKLAARVEKQLAHADSFVMEALINDQGTAEFVRRMYFTDGRRLEPLLGEALYRRTAALLGRYGLPAQAVTSIRPWGAFITLSEPPAQLGLPLDLVLMRKAEAHGARIFGLETVKEQADIFADMSMADQVALLRDSVCHFDLLQKQIAQLERLYLKQDLAGLQHLSEQYQQGTGSLQRQVMDKLIVQRNRRMARRLVPHLREGNAFIAIGALHLPGEQGVLSLLERQGFSVEPVH